MNPFHCFQHQLHIKESECVTKAKCYMNSRMFTPRTTKTFSATSLKNIVWVIRAPAFKEKEKGNKSRKEKGNKSRIKEVHISALFCCVNVMKLYTTQTYEKILVSWSTSDSPQNSGLENKTHKCSGRKTKKNVILNMRRV